MSGLGRIPRRRAQYSGLLRFRRPRRTKGAFANPPWPPDCIGLSEASEGQWWESIAEVAARAAPSFSPSRPRSQSVREQAEEGEPSRTTGSRPSMQASPSCPSSAPSCVGAGLLLSRRSGNRTPVYLLPHSHPTEPVHIEIRARLYKG